MKHVKLFEQFVNEPAELSMTYRCDNWIEENVGG
jgi:hypothetical protein